MVGNELQAFRAALEAVDHRLLRLLRERMELVEGGAAPAAAGAAE